MGSNNNNNNNKNKKPYSYRDQKLILIAVVDYVTL